MKIIIVLLAISTTPTFSMDYVGGMWDILSPICLSGLTGGGVAYTCAFAVTQKALQRGTLPVALYQEMLADVKAFSQAACLFSVWLPLNWMVFKKPDISYVSSVAVGLCVGIFVSKIFRETVLGPKLISV